MSGTKETKFTPNEWMAKRYNGKHPEMWVETNEEPIARIENKGDLYLIAQAPAMYQTLEQHVRWFKILMKNDYTIAPILMPMIAECEKLLTAARGEAP